MDANNEFKEPKCRQKLTQENLSQNEVKLKEIVVDLFF